LVPFPELPAPGAGIQKVIDPVAELYQRCVGRCIKDTAYAVGETGCLAPDRIFLGQRIHNGGDVISFIIGKRKVCDKSFRLRNPFRSTVLIDIMQPRSYDGYMLPAKHPNKGGNPGRVDDIRGSPVLAKLSLMGTCDMIGSSLDRQQSLTYVRVCAIRSCLHTKKSCREPKGLLFYTREEK
jgi:hypothetical protein